MRLCQLFCGDRHPLSELSKTARPVQRLIDELALLEIALTMSNVDCGGLALLKTGYR